MAEVGVISVQGVGKVSVRPDLAIVTFKVITDGKRPSLAVQANTERMKVLNEVVASFEIPEKDRQTSGFGIFPQYVYPTAKKGKTQKNPYISSYKCSNGMVLKLRDLDKLSDILAKLTDAGADQVNFSFAVDKRESHEDKCRQLAFDEALRRATIYGDQAKVKIGRIQNLQEQWQQNYHRAPAAAYGGAVTMSAAIEEVPVEAGEEEISVTVNVSFEVGEKK